MSIETKRGSLATLVGLLAVLAITVPAYATTTEGEEPKWDPDVLALVNGEPIWVKDLEVRLSALHGEAREQTRADFSLDRLMDRVINDTLLAQEARALDMHNEPPTDDQVRRFTDELVLDILARQEFEVASRPTDEEIAARYEKIYRRVSLRILTTYEKDEAEAALARLRDGEDFVTLVEEISVDPYRAREGLVNAITRTKLQREIGDIAFASKPGDLGGPVQTKLGYSVFRVESFLEADPEKFDDLRGTVASLIQHEKKRALQEAFRKNVRDTIPVTIDQEAFDAVGFKRLDDARLIQDVPDPAAAVAHVGESRVVTAGDFGHGLLSNLSGVRNEDAAVAMKPMVLDKLIEEQLFLEAATRRGIFDRPDVQAAIHRKETALLAPRFLEDIVTADIEVTTEEMKAYYEENKDRFQKPPRVRIGQITVESQEEAERIVGLLRDGADLAWLAKQYSIDRFKDAGGDRGWEDLTPGVDAVADWMLQANPGDVHDTIGAPGNWQALMLTGKQDRGVYEYREVSGNVRNKVVDIKVLEVLDTYLTALRERSDIRMNESALDSLRVMGEMAEESEATEGPHGGHAH